ncbi:membrane protein [Streptomyces netropsis]|nr:membrane protein [Streptomyces netropsis]
MVSTEGGTPDSKRRRKHSPLAVVSVAAAVLLAGGGGAYWATTAADGKDASPPGGTGAPAPLALDGYGRSGGGSGPSRGIAVGEPDPNGTRYRAEGKLPDGPRTAPVYLPGREVDRSEVAALAKVLKVAGTPRLVQDVWQVGGTPDAAGPTLQVQRTGPGNWSFSRYGIPGGKPCVPPSGDGPEKTMELSGADPSGTTSSKPCPSFRDGSSSPSDGGEGPVSEEKAKQAASPVLKALGQDDAKIDASGLFGAVRTVAAEPVLGGVTTYGWQTSLKVGADAQLVGGSGTLQSPTKGATYPLITAAEALKELNKGGGTGRVVIGGCASAVPHGTDGGTAVEPTPPCLEKSLGKTKQREPALVRGASFALAAHSVGGRQALVPSWLFQVQQPGADKADKKGTITIAQPAVDPKFIAKPAPAPTAPTGKPSSVPPKSGPLPVESYTVDGDKLTLRFWGGVCSDFSASAEESSDEVKVKITGTEKEPGKVCVMMAKTFEQTVTLDEPLEDRKVVDAKSGERVAEKQAK